MKRSLVARLLLAAVFVVAALPSVARAEDPFRKLGKDIKKDANHVAHDVEHPKDAEKDMKKAGKEVEHGAERAGHDIEHPKDLVKDSKHMIAESELGPLSEEGFKSFKKELREGADDFKKMCDEAKAWFTELEEKALRSVVMKDVEKYGKFLADLTANVHALQALEAGGDLVKQIIHVVVTRKKDPKLGEDIERIGLALGLIDGYDHSILPGGSHGLFKSCWGVAFGIRAGVTGGAELPVYAGASGVVGFIAAGYEEPGKPYEYSFFFEPSVQAGGGAGIPVDGEIMFLWMPGTVDEAQALYAGLTTTLSGAAIVEKSAARIQNVAIALQMVKDPTTGKWVKQSQTDQTTAARDPQAAGEKSWTMDAEKGAQGVGLGVTLGVRLRILQDAFKKGGFKFPTHWDDLIPSFYIGAEISSGAGYVGGIEVSQMFTGKGIEEAIKETGGGGKH